MQAPKPYENDRLAQFLWVAFKTEDFFYEMVGLYKTLSLTYILNKP